MKHLLVSLAVAILAIAGSPMTHAQEKIITDTKEKTKEIFKDGKKGVTNLFNKAKDKVGAINIGKDAGNDSIIAKKEKKTETAKADKKAYNFKKQKVKETYNSRQKRTFSTKTQKYKTPGGETLRFSFDAVVWYDEETNQIKHRYYIFREIWSFDKKIVIPAGDEILMRMANQDVCKAVTLWEYTNEKETETARNSMTGVSYGSYLVWGDVYAYWYMADDVVQQIIDSGIIKLRTGQYDIILEGKTFDKAHQAMADYLLSLKEQIEFYERAWTNRPPLTQQREEF